MIKCIQTKTPPLILCNSNYIQAKTNDMIVYPYMTDMANIKSDIELDLIHLFYSNSVMKGKSKIGLRKFIK